MRLELQDINGRQFIIDTENVATLLSWFEEMLPRIEQASQNNYPAKLFIWPTGDKPRPPLSFIEMDRTGFQTVATYFRDLAAGE